MDSDFALIYAQYFDYKSSYFCFGSGIFGALLRAFVQLHADRSGICVAILPDDFYLTSNPLAVFMHSCTHVKPSPIY